MIILILALSDPFATKGVEYLLVLTFLADLLNAYLDPRISVR